MPSWTDSAFELVRLKVPAGREADRAAIARIEARAASYIGREDGES